MSTRRARDATVNLQKATSQVNPDFRGVAKKTNRKIINRIVPPGQNSPPYTSEIELLTDEEIVAKEAGNEQIILTGPQKVTKNIIWVLIAVVITFLVVWIVGVCLINVDTYNNQMAALNKSYAPILDESTLDRYLELSTEIRDSAMEGLQKLFYAVCSLIIGIIVIAIAKLLGGKFLKPLIEGLF